MTKFLIVTGMSGAGKSAAANMLEDLGFYVIDNMPTRLISRFADVISSSGSTQDKYAVVTDIRGIAANIDTDIYKELTESLDFMHTKGEDITFRIVFFDASNETLIHRFKETRRLHPLDSTANGSLEKAIELERQMLAGMRDHADYYVDTTDMNISRFRDKVTDMFMDNPDDRMTVKVMSFGFKYGMCSEADLVFDVRCLPNPFYIEELKRHTGLESCVRDYVMQFEQSKELENRLESLLDFLIPLYRKEGKTSLTVAFGCTGGKHRSVTFAENIYRYLSDQHIRTRIDHRDIEVGKIK